jgi:hypothetical protein
VGGVGRWGKTDIIKRGMEGADACAVGVHEGGPSTQNGGTRAKETQKGEGGNKQGVENL